MFETANEFSMFIESLAADNNLSVVDTVLEYCEENYIEPEEISKLINRSLKDKLEISFIDMNYLPKHSTLDFIWNLLHNLYLKQSFILYSY